MPLVRSRVRRRHAYRHLLAGDEVEVVHCDGEGTVVVLLIAQVTASPSKSAVMLMAASAIAVPMVLLAVTVRV